MDVHLGRQAQGLERKSGHFPCRVPSIRRHPAVIGAQAQRGGRRPPCRNRHQVVYRQRLVHRGERMKAVRTRRADVKAEVDLGMGPDGGGHGDYCRSASTVLFKPRHLRQLFLI